MPPRKITPMIGMMMSLTRESTIRPKAPPMITPTARSMTLPRAMNSWNSFSILRFSFALPAPGSAPRSNAACRKDTIANRARGRTVKSRPFPGHVVCAQRRGGLGAPPVVASSSRSIGSAWVEDRVGRAGLARRHHRDRLCDAALRHREPGRSWAAAKGAGDSRPFIYSLSLAIYCTSWTFFGSVGLASERGLEFVAIYIGPVLVFLFGFPLLSRIVRLAKAEKITSIADFLAPATARASPSGSSPR